LISGPEVIVTISDLYLGAEKQYRNYYDQERREKIGQI